MFPGEIRFACEWLTEFLRALFIFYLWCFVCASQMCVPQHVEVGGQPQLLVLTVHLRQGLLWFAVSYARLPGPQVFWILLNPPHV